MTNFETLRTIPKKNRFSLRKLLKLRYRAYALVVIFILSAILFSSDKNIPDNVSISGLAYKVKSQNVLAKEIERVSLDTLVSNAPQPKLEPIKKTEGKVGLQGEQVIVYDNRGEVLTDKLKRFSGIDMGFLSSKPFDDRAITLSITQGEIADFDRRVKDGTVKLAQPPKTLDDIVGIPPKLGNLRDLLVYEKYKITVPIFTAGMDDLFKKNPDDSYNYTSIQDTNDTKSPVQILLQSGIVHLGYTPDAGELGNSYIIGHSSNYSYIQSPYNKVFQPLESKTQPGEEFTIYDRFGRALRFRVFEAKKIDAADVNEAFKGFLDKRVVTLQTSILGFKDGRWQATHRWLTRGELII